MSGQDEGMPTRTWACHPSGSSLTLESGLGARLGGGRRVLVLFLAGGLGGLLVGEPAIVALQDRPVLGREPLGHRLEDAVALAARELAPVLARLIRVDQRADPA